ncbi:TonB-dependent receptor, partial [Phenylobacterium sp.]|uniref:TonB-dependent receptor n=1 Tax=Phenylobacterium sp. TaxID=1871053 RepID=UPI002F3F7CC2
AFYTREDNLLHQNLNGLSVANAPQVLPGLGGLEVVQLPSTYDEYAGFANVDYHFTDRFDVSAGGRYSHNEQKSSQTTSGALVGPTPSVVSGTSSEGVFTFAVAPKYKLTDDATVYARISKGYRPGGPNALSPLAPTSVPRTFDSDSLVNYEVGIKGDAMEHQVAYDLSAFYIDWSRIQLLAAVNGFGVNTNGGSAKSEGVEGNLTWAVTPDLTLSANGAYIQANLTSDTGPLLGGHDGDRLPYVSPISGALDANYSHALSGDIRGFVGGSVRFTGRRRSDFNPTIGQISLPSYSQVDLRAGLEWQQYRIELFAKNVGDERGILSIGGLGSTPRGAVQAGLISPRLVGVSLSARY